MLIGQNIALYLFKHFVGKTRLDMRIFFGNVLIAILISAFFILIAEQIINLFFGNEYNEVIVLSKIMIIGAMINSIYQIPDAFMNANSNGNQILFSSIFMGFVALFSAYFLIPVYGIIGAGIAFVLANLAYLISILYFYKNVIINN